MYFTIEVSRTLVVLLFGLSGALAAPAPFTFSPLPDAAANVSALTALGSTSVKSTLVKRLFISSTPSSVSTSDLHPLSERAEKGVTLSLKRYVPRTVHENETHPIIAHHQKRRRAQNRWASLLSNATSPSSTPEEDVGTLLKRALNLTTLQPFPSLTKRNPSTSSSSSSSKSANTFAIEAAVPPQLDTSLPLDEFGSDITYFSSLLIGSSQKEFSVVMDSGSSDLWVMSANCTDAACMNHDTLSTADSTSLAVSGSPFQITYGSGAVEGVLVQDTVQFGDAAGIPPVQGLTFGLSERVSNQFASLPTDGILGLGNQAASAEGVPTLLSLLLPSLNSPSQNQIGVNLQRAADGTRDGQVDLGILDTTKFDPTAMVFVDNVSERGLWEVEMDDVQVGGIGLNLTGRTAIVDTGTTLILAPPSDALALHQLIPGAAASSSDASGATMFYIPCTTTTALNLVISSTPFTISPKDYVGSPVGGGMCVSNIVGESVGGAGEWLVGDVFLKNVYVVFEYGKQQVGLAPQLEGTGTAQTVVSASASASATSTAGAKGVKSAAADTGNGTATDVKAMASSSVAMRLASVGMTAWIVVFSATAGILLM
ncbi:acid protease [Saitoella complicata NRRL Y-17804]|uniref:acid protease n=1 Tax=Saitoella complicata (strain BCRC 22490 / CBS 7301 / JCM 7358 / NBRC 10748 / NRRL Y-17804) TaxID=698492 RepID=UPI000867E913|nr:acid protease [Saitoella complicata NRRL Y-17804]ODQ55813.1 acid protease [Saitoella complicata NRRL Y-17804]